MITFHNIGYMGRLGNQMFQFASTLGIGKRKGYDVKFPIENCFISQRTGPIDVKTGGITDVKCDLLDCFDIPNDYFVSRNLIPVNNLYNERSFEYDSLTENIPDYVSLNGYFQTEKYFLDIKDTIKKTFNFKKEFREPGDEFLESISGGKEIISIHVRRGDYTLYPDHHPTCDSDYYKNAILEIKKVSGEDIKIIVFSDDKEWCIQNLGDYIGKDFIIPSTINPYIELYMMTRCNYHIIANSSFSWWGSWLSDSKLTVSPYKWFGPLMDKNTQEIYCKNWIVL